MATCMPEVKRPHVQVVDVVDAVDGLQVGGDVVDLHPGGDVLAEDGEDLAPQHDGTDGDERADGERDDACPSSESPVAATRSPAAMTPTDPAVSATTSR